MSCPGDLLSGLVDGELDHATREQVLSHLLGCAPCRAETEALRALKTRLSWAGAETPVPSDVLADRLLGLVVPGVEPIQRTAASARPVSVRPAARPGGPTGPRRRPQVRRRTVGGAIVALGLGAAFVLGGQTARESQLPVDPGTDSFVADFVNSTVEVPLTDPVDAAVVGISR